MKSFSSLLFLLPYLSSRRRGWAGVFAAVAGVALCLLLVPVWARSLPGFFEGRGSLWGLLARLFWGGAILAAAAWLTFRRDYAASGLTLGVAARVREDMARRILAVNPELVRRMGPDFVSRATLDAALLQSSLTTVALFFIPNLAALSVLVVAMLHYSPALTVLAGAVMAPVAVLLARTGGVLLSTAASAQEGLVPVVADLGRMMA